MFFSYLYTYIFLCSSLSPSSSLLFLLSSEQARSDLCSLSSQYPWWSTTDIDGLQLVDADALRLRRNVVVRTSSLTFRKSQLLHQAGYKGATVAECLPTIHTSLVNCRQELLTESIHEASYSTNWFDLSSTLPGAISCSSGHKQLSLDLLLPRWISCSRLCL